MTISLENLADGSISDRNFLKLMALVLDTGGKSLGLRFGVSSLTFTASVNSANTTVTHGLGKTPIIVLTTNMNAPGFGNFPTVNTASYGATTFLMNGEVKSSFTGSVGIAWVVIG